MAREAFHMVLTTSPAARREQFPNRSISQAPSDSRRKPPCGFPHAGRHFAESPALMLPSQRSPPVGVHAQAQLAAWIRHLNANLGGPCLQGASHEPCDVSRLDGRRDGAGAGDRTAHCGATCHPDRQIDQVIAVRGGRPWPAATADHQLTTTCRSGQQPVPVTRVAAAAAVLNRPTSVAANPNSLSFIVHLEY